MLTGVCEGVNHEGLGRATTALVTTYGQTGDVGLRAWPSSSGTTLTAAATTSPWRSTATRRCQGSKPGRRRVTAAKSS